MFIDFEVWGGIRFTSVGIIYFGVEQSLKNWEKMLLEALLPAPCFRAPVCLYSFPLCISGCDQHTFLQTQDVPFHGISLLVIN